MNDLSAVVVWLDRDGTLLDDPGYLDDPEAMRFLAGADRAVARLSKAGVRVVLITNQSGIGRGLMEWETVDAIHRRLVEKLREAGGELAGIYLCPHRPEGRDGGEGCDCRKPAPGMVLRARSELGLGKAQEFVIGDKEADVALARAVGASGVLVLTGEGRASLGRLEAEGSAPDHVAEDLSAAVDWILGIFTGEA